MVRTAAYAKGYCEPRRSEGGSQRSDRRKFVLARRQNQHARRARYPVVSAFPKCNLGTR